MMAAFWWMQHEGGYHLFGTTHHILTGRTVRLGRRQRPQPAAAPPVLPRVSGDEDRRTGRRVQPRAPRRLRALGRLHVPARPLPRLQSASSPRGRRSSYIVFPWHLGTDAARIARPPRVPAAPPPGPRRRGSTTDLVAVLARRARHARMLAHVRLLRSDGGRRRGRVRARPPPSRRRSGEGPLSIVGYGRRRAIGASLVVGVLSIISGFGRGAGLHRVARGPRGVRRSSPRASPSRARKPRSRRLVEWDLRAIASTARTRPRRGTTSGSSRSRSRSRGSSSRGEAGGTLPRGFRSATAGLTGVFVVALLLAAPSPVSVLGHDDLDAVTAGLGGHPRDSSPLALDRAR